jgi:hypothetical protein
MSRIGEVDLCLAPPLRVPEESMIGMKRAAGTVFAAVAFAAFASPSAGAATVPAAVPTPALAPAWHHHGHHYRHHWRWDDCDCDDLWGDECWDGVTFTCEGIDPEDDWDGGGGHWWSGWRHWGHGIGFGHGWGGGWGGLGGWGWL